LSTGIEKDCPCAKKEKVFTPPRTTPQPGEKGLVKNKEGENGPGAERHIREKWSSPNSDEIFWGRKGDDRQKTHQSKRRSQAQRNGRGAWGGGGCLHIGKNTQGKRSSVLFKGGCNENKETPDKEQESSRPTLKKRMPGGHEGERKPTILDNQSRGEEWYFLKRKGELTKQGRKRLILERAKSLSPECFGHR